MTAFATVYDFTFIVQSSIIAGLDVVPNRRRTGEFNQTAASGMSTWISGVVLCCAIGWAACVMAGNAADLFICGVGGGRFSAKH